MRMQITSLLAIMAVALAIPAAAPPGGEGPQATERGTQDTEEASQATKRGTQDTEKASKATEQGARPPIVSHKHMEACKKKHNGDKDYVQFCADDVKHKCENLTCKTKWDTSECLDGCLGLEYAKKAAYEKCKQEHKGDPDDTDWCLYARKVACEGECAGKFDALDCTNKCLGNVYSREGYKETCKRDNDHHVDVESCVNVSLMQCEEVTCYREWDRKKCIEECVGIVTAP